LSFPRKRGVASRSTLTHILPELGNHTLYNMRLTEKLTYMDNYRNLDNKHRRYKAHVSVAGTTQFHLRNPYIIAWWSAAFPGFGHLLLSKYLRGLVLFVWEVFVNYQSKINQAMVQSFCGDIELAKETLDIRWMLMYIPVYLFAIWDSYRTTVDMNKVHLLAERENARPLIPLPSGRSKSITWTNGCQSCRSSGRCLCRDWGSYIYTDCSRPFFRWSGRLFFYSSQRPLWLYIYFSSGTSSNQRQCWINNGFCICLLCGALLFMTPT
jgi:hypothetical protein